MRSAFHSSWEARHDVNNLDHYQNIVKESEPTPSQATRKRRLSNPNQKPSKKSKVNENESPAKTPGKSNKVTFQEETSSPKTPGKSLKLKSPATSGININMELVPQLRTTPRKFGEMVRRNSQAENVPKALGLVPKTPDQVKKCFQNLIFNFAHIFTFFTATKNAQNTQNHDTANHQHGL